MKTKLYLETSVINFLIADDEPEKREITKNFFKKVKEEHEIFISQLEVIQ